MSDRYLDACGPFVVWPPDEDSGVDGADVDALFETLDHDRGTVVLEVRVAREDDDDDDSVPVRLTCFLHTGACTPNDGEAAAFLTERPWFDEQLQAQMNLVRRRAWRAVAQRDRDTAAHRLLATAEPGKMIPFHALFPADWDLILSDDDTYYWVVDHYCSNPACDCMSVALTLHQLREGKSPLVVGEAQLNLADERALLDVNTPAARELFSAFREEYEETIRDRREEARRAVLRHAPALRKPAPVATPVIDPSAASRAPRNAPCPCGSGKKYKRCCLASSTARPGIAAPRS